VERIEALALIGAAVYCEPEAEPLRDAAVLLRRTIVAAVGARNEVHIPDDATIVNCEGCTIVAGFWNCHVHFHERKWSGAQAVPALELESELQQLTRFGFTTTFDLSSCWENTRQLRDRIEASEVRGPKILSTGEGLIPAGGSPSEEVYRTLGLMPTSLCEVASSGEARSAVIKLLGQGVDGIKLFISAPSAGQLAPETVRAVVDEAHLAGKPVFAHPNTASDIAVALDGGVDVIAHTTPRSGPWDARLLETMRGRGCALVPTLMLWDDLMRHDRLSIRTGLVLAAVEQLRAWHGIGGTILFGTDLGAVKYDPGDEFVLMADAGLTFPEILASLTTAPARQFGQARGTIGAGDAADLVVLHGDPAKNLRQLSSVRYTIRAGEIVYPRGQSLAHG
jgi:imidazolonepropionase-like amidohydrolase